MLPRSTVSPTSSWATLASGLGRAAFGIVLVAALGGLCRAQAAPGLRFKLYLNQGYRCFQGAQYEKSRDYFVRAAELDCNSAEARMALADAYTALGAWGEAVTQLRHGLFLDPAWTDRDLPRYGMFRKADDLDRLIKTLKKQSADYPNDVNVRILLGYNCFHLNLLEESRESIEQAKQLAPGDEVVKAYDKALAARKVGSAKSKEDEEKKKAQESKSGESSPKHPTPGGAGGGPGGGTGAGPGAAPGGVSVPSIGGPKGPIIPGPPAGPIGGAPPMIPGPPPMGGPPGPAGGPATPSKND